MRAHLLESVARVEQPHMGSLDEVGPNAQAEQESLNLGFETVVLLRSQAITALIGYALESSTPSLPCRLNLDADLSACT